MLAEEEPSLTDLQVNCCQLTEPITDQRDGAGGRDQRAETVHKVADTNTIKFGFSKRHGISTISRDLVLLGRLVLLVKMVKLVPLVLLALLVKLVRLVKLAVAGWVHQCSV